jgi:hypothetical protein
MQHTGAIHCCAPIDIPAQSIKDYDSAAHVQCQIASAQHVNQHATRAYSYVTIHTGVHPVCTKGRPPFVSHFFWNVTYTVESFGSLVMF